jgi:hypothetical protein
MARINDLRGNSKDRRARKLFLLNQVTEQNPVPDGVHAPCWECGKTVTYDTMIVDRIDEGKFGGRYVRQNIRIHCEDCSLQQGYRLGMGAKYVNAESLESVND